MPIIPWIQRLFRCKQLAMLHGGMPHIEVSQELCEYQHIQ
jgi:hypothetical protein